VRKLSAGLALASCTAQRKGTLEASSSNLNNAAAWNICQLHCRFILKAQRNRKGPHRFNETLACAGVGCGQPSLGRGPMNDPIGCRDMELLCRQRATLDIQHSWKWLGEAERWKDLAHREIGSRFRAMPMHAGPMAMGPNTIEGDLRNR
jgi:hypothetical protein